MRPPPHHVAPDPTISTSSVLRHLHPHPDFGTTICLKDFILIRGSLSSNEVAYFRCTTASHLDSVYNECMTHAYSLKPDAVENSTTQSRLREHFIQWAPLAKIAGTAAKKDERRRTRPVPAKSQKSTSPAHARSDVRCNHMWHCLTTDRTLLDCPLLDCLLKT